MTRKLLVALAAAMACALPMMASALDQNLDLLVEGSRGVERYSTVVSLADLNLKSDQDVRWANARLSKASKKVCGFVNGSILTDSRDYMSCVDEAFDNARVDLDRMVSAQRQS